MLKSLYSYWLSVYLFCQLLREVLKSSTIIEERLIFFRSYLSFFDSCTVEFCYEVHKNLGLLHLLANLILSCNQMSLFIFISIPCFVWILRSAILIALPASLQLTVCLSPLFNLSLSLNLKCVSWRQHIVSPCLFIQTVNLCLLIHVFTPFSLYVTINILCWSLPSCQLFCSSQLLLLLSLCSCLLFDCFQYSILLPILPFTSFHYFLSGCSGVSSIYVLTYHYLCIIIYQSIYNVRNLIPVYLISPLMSLVGLLIYILFLHILWISR